MAANAAPEPWFLSGNYAPVHDELTEFDLEISGAVPSELRGTYIRNTPNPKDGKGDHWFFGDGMVHGVRLEDGKAAWYRNRWVKTPKLERGAGAMDPEVTFRSRSRVNSKPSDPSTTTES